MDTLQDTTQNAVITPLIVRGERKDLTPPAGMKAAYVVHLLPMGPLGIERETALQMNLYMCPALPARTKICNSGGVDNAMRFDSYSSAINIGLMWLVLGQDSFPLDCEVELIWVPTATPTLSATQIDWS